MKLELAWSTWFCMRLLTIDQAPRPPAPITQNNTLYSRVVRPRLSRANAWDAAVSRTRKLGEAFKRAPRSPLQPQGSRAPTVSRAGRNRPRVERIQARSTAPDGGKTAAAACRSALPPAQAPPRWLKPPPRSVYRPRTIASTLNFPRGNDAGLVRQSTPSAASEVAAERAWRLQLMAAGFEIANTSHSSSALLRSNKLCTNRRGRGAICNRFAADHGLR